MCCAVLCRQAGRQGLLILVTMLLRCDQHLRLCNSPFLTRMAWAACSTVSGRQHAIRLSGLVAVCCCWLVGLEGSTWVGWCVCLVRLSLLCFGCVCLCVSLSLRTVFSGWDAAPREGVVGVTSQPCAASTAAVYLGSHRICCFHHPQLDRAAAACFGHEQQTAACDQLSSFPAS